MAWQLMKDAPSEPGAKIMAFDGERVGEAVAYEQWTWSEDDEDTIPIIEWRWANDSCGCCWEAADPQPVLWQPLPEINLRERILSEVGRTYPDRIDIGWDAWTELKLDRATMHEMSCVEDKLFFKGIEINPFAADIGPGEYRLHHEPLA